MNKENTLKLIKTFPLLYSNYDPLFRKETKMAFNFDVMDGWFNLIWKLSKDIYTEIERLQNEGVPLDRLPRVTQVKEKYGTLVFNVVGFNDKIYKWVAEAEDKSLTICEICGNVGEPNVDLATEPVHTWIMVRCPEHWGITPSQWYIMQRDKKREDENFYTEENIKNMMEKAKNSFDSIDFTKGITICANKKCPRKEECFRYTIFHYLVINDIRGHTCTVFDHENCNHFIQLQK